MATAMMTGRPISEWIHSHEAMNILCVSRPALRRLIEDGELTSRKVPGCRAMVLRSEVERLADLSTYPARPKAMACAGLGA